MDAVRRSASQFNSPDTLLGFGIPNFQTAYQLLMPNGVASERNHTGKLSIYPNPAGDDQPLMLSFESSEYEPVDVAVFNSFGSRVHHDTLWVVPGLNVIPFNGHKNLSPGIYYLQINASKFSFSNGFVKR
jgi:hypothetical protein